ncbi:nucleoside recognition domain-containing protein [Proteiniphilum sp. X52]|uniref:nucleoside recognition domain-containing protein n=1 Tax=Proteiniphilum sp. X52 TaxID=2382159 RepID=UPI000F0A2C1B|nr:nucleoside recognition domain-containing protein [Proteiniphilum sp. X52]RNC66807.1 hypothetical protein D7D25_00630 [Proteiniphilum sp. X52]
MSNKYNILQSFVDGARNGLRLGVLNMLPHVLFAFAIIRILNLAGLTNLIGVVFEPIMKVFGLPGVSATALVTALLSTGGGMGVAASLALDGLLSAGQIAILLVGIMLLGSLIQYTGRILGTIKIPSKSYLLLVVVNLLIAFAGMFFTKLFV